MQHIDPVKPFGVKAVLDNFHNYNGGMMTIKDKYAIVGVGYTPQGRVSGRTSLSFHLEASANAIKDAGLNKDDVDGFICYRHFPAASDEDDLTPQFICQQLGISPAYVSQDAN
jgi:acetyl-CoA acetyltransferase